MPGLDGLASPRCSGELGDELRIAFISGRGRFEHQLEGLERGAADYITKPFDPEELGRTGSRAARRPRCGVEIVSDTFSTPR